MDKIHKILIEEFKLKPSQVQNTIKLIDDGCTIPFIARYRKEMTGSLDDQVLRELHERLVYLRSLEERRADVLRLISEQEKLTDEIAKTIENAKNLQELEDIYRPFKPKRRTRATIAKEKGLEPLANLIMLQNFKQSVLELAKKFVNPEKGVNNEEEAIDGAVDIIAEGISDNAEYRKKIREIFFKEGVIVTKAKKEEDSVYRMYYDFKEPVAKIVGHRILAINRGEKEGFLTVKIIVAETTIINFLAGNIIRTNYDSSVYLRKAIDDSYKRLIQPSIERETRNQLTEMASESGIKVFSENLKALLLQPPVKGKTVLGVDPAYRTGCKLAVVDETGKVLNVGVIYPTPPQSKVEEAKKIVKEVIKKYKVDMIAIGNGTASKESEIFISDLIKEIDREVYYMVVNEAGASVYSASKLGAQEFPDYDVALRSAVSISRRLQDPLAELVKIDPKSIGVGQYQHDMNAKRLDESLSGVVEYCVNSVGVDLNTASPSLLKYISGINATVAKNIVDYREKNGVFKSRKELLKVSKIGDKAFEQCAGFLRIPDSANILDNTSVHPESYEAAKKLLEITGYNLEDVANGNISSIKDAVKKVGKEKIATEAQIGIPTLDDIIKELQKPGRDMRDELPKPLLLKDIMHMEDLKAGMELKGTVRNVADFGVFVDIGVHQDGLVHISELADKYVKNPMEIVSVGDIVNVRVIDVDVARKRISLSMKKK